MMNSVSRNIPAESEQMADKLTEATTKSDIVSLFAGCGGLDLGFTGGFNQLVELMGISGNATHALHAIQNESFAHQNRSTVAIKFNNYISFFNHVTILDK